MVSVNGSREVIMAIASARASPLSRVPSKMSMPGSQSRRVVANSQIEFEEFASADDRLRYTEYASSVHVETADLVLKNEQERFSMSLPHEINTIFLTEGG